MGGMVRMDGSVVGWWRAVWLMALALLPWVSGCGNGGMAPECVQAADCDDDDPCTRDTCTDAGECAYSAAADGGACDDGLYCTDGDTCFAGSCRGGTASPCGGDTLICSESLGACVACVNDSDCPVDELFCNGAPSCVNNVCVTSGDPCASSATTPVCDDALDMCVACREASDCDDENPCTDDACGNNGACTHTPNDTNPCDDDGDLCNGAESCVAGVCTSDGVDPCTGGSLPYCDTATNACVACTDAAHCVDGAFCNGAERCVAGSCEPALEVACADAVNGCDEGRDVCLDCHLGSDCHDGDACTTDVCRGGSCEHGPCPMGTTCMSGVCRGCTSAGDCDDGNPCTTDSCNTGTGECGWTDASNGTPCDDGVFCTAPGASCLAGTCFPMNGATCGGTTPICDEGGETCLGCATASDCDDGNACTTDVCNVDGSCSRTPVVCADDGVACTITHCDRALGCVSTSMRDTLVALQFRSTDTILSVRGNAPSVTVPAGLYLCTGPGACVAPPGPVNFPTEGTIDLPLSLVLSTLPELSGGELALSTASDGSEVCDYVRWSDSMSAPATALGLAAASQGEWDGGVVDTSTAPAAPPTPGICWLDVWGGGAPTAGNDAASDWGYCPHCGDCRDADPCTYDYCDDQTMLCVHDDALREALAGIDFDGDTVSLRNTSSAVAELPLAVGVCTAPDMASCEVTTGSIGAAGLSVELTQDLVNSSGELALMVMAGPGGFQLCDYARWSGGAAAPSTALGTEAESSGEWTAATAIDSTGASAVVHAGGSPNSSAAAWSSAP
ncbi:MAG: hypothetical protein R3B40_24735 [Polyangiales bacterium]